MSVLRDDRAAPAVVHANGGQIDVLTDAIGCREQEEPRSRESDVPGTHEQMVVFEGDRPIRSEAVFETCADRATPTGLPGTVDKQACRNGEGPILVASNRGTALDVDQDVVPGIADLTREQAERIDPRLVPEPRRSERRREEQAGVGTLEVSPVALGLQAEHPAARLPTVADLTTDRAAGGVMTSLRNGRGKRGYNAAWDKSIADEIPALAARPPPAIGADVEAAPVIEGRGHGGRRLGVRTGGEVGSGGGRSEAKRNKSNGNQQKLFHRISLRFFVLLQLFRFVLKRFNFKRRSPQRIQFREGNNIPVDPEMPSPKSNSCGRSEPPGS